MSTLNNMKKKKDDLEIQESYLRGKMSLTTNHDRVHREKREKSAVAFKLVVVRKRLLFFVVIFFNVSDIFLN